MAYAEERGHFRTCLHEAEYVVDEEKNILALLVAEVLSHRQARKRNTHTGTGRLVHLTEDHRGLVDDMRFVAVGIGVFRFRHFQPKVVAFAGSLTDTGEYRNAAVFGRNVADKLLHGDRFADTCAAKEADLAALEERAKQIDNLHAGFENFNRGCLIFDGRCATVNWVRLAGSDRTRVRQWACRAS